MTVLQKQHDATIHATPAMGPVRKNIVSGIAGNLPDSEVFSRPEFVGMGFSMSHGFGRDGLVRKAGRMAIPMFLTSRPPDARKNADGGFQPRIGAEAMTTVNSTATPKASPLGATPASPVSSIAHQQAIENALSMALHYLRHADTPQGIHAATAKAIRAASMLKQACAEMANSGRACHE